MPAPAASRMPTVAPSNVTSPFLRVLRLFVAGRHGREKCYEKMKIVCRNDIKQSRYVADIMMKSPRANVALRIAMAALTSLVTIQWHSASVSAGECGGAVAGELVSGRCGAG